MSIPNDLERLIDRLVDGELSEPERRALLGRLDDSGWKRCALAFLEAQSWRESLGPAAFGAARVEPAEPAAKPKDRSPRVTLVRLSAAATVAGAFALGWLARGGPGPSAPGPIEVASASAPAARTQDAPPSVEGPSPDPDPVRDQGLDPPAIPEAVLADWRSQGYAVEQRSRRVTLGLEDGRRVDVPVNELRLRFLGDRTF